MGESISNDELTKILSTVSHEVRSPISAVKGYLTAINDGVVPEKDLRKYIDTCIRESDRAIRLLENIMAISKIASGAAKPDFSPIDLNELVRLAVIEKATDAEKKNITVKTDFSDEKAFVLADRNMITQVLVNLIDNAVKYGKENGHIILKTVSGKDTVSFSCENDGKGIKKEDLVHIFEKFYQSERSSAGYSGHGLGLPLVKDILLLHGSDIFAESECGKKTVFTFFLKKA